MASDYLQGASLQFVGLHYETSLYELHGPQFTNRYYILSGAGTRQLMAFPEVVGFDSYHRYPDHPPRRPELPGGGGVRPKRHPRAGHPLRLLRAHHRESHHHRAGHQVREDPCLQRPGPRHRRHHRDGRYPAAVPVAGGGPLPPPWRQHPQDHLLHHRRHPRHRPDGKDGRRHPRRLPGVRGLRMLLLRGYLHGL